MDEPKEEIYKFLRDQHDKIVAARESLISRYGNIRLLAGLLLTVFSFSISVNSKTIENSHSDSARIIALLPLAALIVALYYVTRALITIPGLVGHVDIDIPAPDENEIKKFEEGLEDNDLDVNNIVVVFSKNYLKAIKKNQWALKEARINLERSGNFIRAGLIFTIVFLLLTLLSNVLVMWLFAKA